MSSIERPSTWFTSRTHSLSRGPRIGWFKYALASSREEIEYLTDIGLWPRPLICGNMNHIQCDVFMPFRSSERTRSKIGSCESTKRWRSKGSLVFVPWGIKSVPSPTSGPSVPRTNDRQPAVTARFLGRGLRHSPEKPTAHTPSRG